MSTHEQITNNPTSAVRNTGGRNGPQGLEEPMSDEILREMCDKNYHQLLPLIAEKMKKEKEQKDKLNAVKARLIYGEESHYSESKTPTARTEPRRRHGDRYSRSPSPHASVFKRLKKNRSPSPQPRPRKEGGVFNRLGRKEPATSARSDSRRRSPQAKRTEVETRRHQQKSRTTSQYLNKVKTLAKSFKEFSIKQIPRSENKKADALSKIASTSFAHLNKQVLVEELKEKSINEKEILDVVEEEGNTWMTPICEYLTKEILPEDKKKARAVRRKAARYAMINGTLYKKSFLGPWLRCVGPLQANYVLREIHEGSCSMHSGPRSVVAKVIQTGYYWPTMHMDARNLIRECNDCQIHRPVPRNPQQNLTPITSPWPFYKWGIDIAGPFPEGPGKVKFLIVAIDYFTKWIEAKAVATITGNQVKKFVWDNIVCRFGLPGEIISDNGKQFRDNPFKDWCEKLCIRQCFASVKHPQANGLVERANRSLGEGIKARLEEKSKDWIEELPHVLWAHRTMIKSSNGETPFSLTYGTEAVIPAEIGMPTLRTAEIDQTKNNEALGINLDLIEERREKAAIQEAKSKKKMEKYYNSRVRGTSFKPGDMVYRSNEASHAKDEGKLGPKWEGPYEVKEALGKGAYKLKDCKGNEIPRTWNIFFNKKRNGDQQEDNEYQWNTRYIAEPQQAVQRKASADNGSSMEANTPFQKGRTINKISFHFPHPLATQAIYP
ncbi:reverse transcriptase domain-containing protein [Tanacetum coccineum]